MNQPDPADAGTLRDPAPPVGEEDYGRGPEESPVRRTTFDLVGELGGRRVHRRRLLKSVAATGLAATLTGLDVASGRAQQPTQPPAPEDGHMAGHDMAEMQPGPPTNQGFAVFVPFHAAILKAAAARLIPTDEHGPGATEAGVVYFVDRQLAKGDVGFRGKEYQLGPYLPGVPTQGEQSALPLRDRFRIGILGLESYAQQTFGQGFVTCSPEQQDKLLSDLERGIPENFGGTELQAQPLTGAPTETSIGLETDVGVAVGAQAFFTLLLDWTMAGYFCDPVQGGNRDMVGWKLIGFPGAHISYFDEIEKYNESFMGGYISLGQYQEQVGGQDP